MKLRHLRLQNFRQHASTEVAFDDGITGIVGPNGAGKSTILEAIAWAVYGSAAARGTNDTIRFARAPGRGRVEVELVAEIGANEYRVVRTLTGADVYLDGGATPAASGIGPSTEYLQSRLGMSREEFFNTYFTGQKELQFLAQMGPTQRGRFLSQVLGYERLRVAQERARGRRNGLRHETEGLRSGLPDPDALRRASEAAESQARAAATALEAAEREEAAAREALATVAPRWETAREARERARELAHAVEIADREREAAERDAARLAREMERIVAAEAELGRLREELAALPDATAACERHRELARLDERRRALLERRAALEVELKEADSRMSRLEQAPDLLRQLEAQIGEQQRALEEVETEVDQRRREWAGAQQDVRTRLDGYRARAKELREQITQLRDAGPDGVCPTCQRPLGAEFEPVVARLEDEWQTLVQDGRWLAQREKQLEDAPAELAAVEERRAGVRRTIEERRERHGRCARAAEELGVLIQESERKRESLDALDAELDGVGVVYDEAAHRRAEAQLTALQESGRRAARLEQIVEARPAREKEQAEVRESAAALVARIEALEREHAGLAYDEAGYRDLGEQHARAEERVRVTELARSEAAGERRTAAVALENARGAEASYREARAKLDDLETELRHHDELDAAFSRLRQELNARVRPELGALASRFITEITDGRYTAIEIDDAYNVMVLDEGEEKPVISGGEEDIANLVLRLAISQMIADRAGHPLSLLILDEVFGSLDVERRDAVIQLLHRLRDRFDQVIVITHIETIHEGLDRVLRVEFDERTGASTVRIEAAQERVEVPEPL